MSPKPHPLDIFRSSDGGFDQASRQPRERRTVSGKVVRSTTRDTTPTQKGARLQSTGRASSRSGSGRSGGGRSALTASAGSKRPSATSRASAGARRSAPARRPSRDGPLLSNRALLYATLAVFGAVSLMLWINGGEEEGPPALKTAGVTGTPIGDGLATDSWSFGNDENSSTEAGTDLDSLIAGDDGVAPPWEQPVDEPQRFTVRVATYLGGSDRVVGSYQGAARELQERGYGDVGLLGYGVVEGRPTKVELVVGNAPAREMLAGTVDALRAIDDWPTGNKRPFQDARVIVHPNPEGAN